MTELSSTEIVLGKLMARLLPLLAGLACTFPIVELLTLLGGVEPVAFLSSFIVAMSVAVLGCAVATFFSLWLRKTFDALLMTYMCLGLWLVSRLVLEFLAHSPAGCGLCLRARSTPFTWRPRRTCGRAAWELTTMFGSAE